MSVDEALKTKRYHSNYLDFERVAIRLGQQYEDTAKKVMLSWRKKKGKKLCQNI